VVEPVSVAKASRMAPLLAEQRPVFTITPNVDELAALVGHPVADEPDQLIAAAGELHRRGVAHVWVSRGAAGSLLIGVDDVKAIEAEPVEVIDVTGAGDAMTAGYVHALLAGEPAATAARWGHLAAAVTLASPQTVRPDLGVAFAARLHTEGAHR
jgi:pseudouridine kinase